MDRVFLSKSKLRGVAWMPAPDLRLFEAVGRHVGRAPLLGGASHFQRRGSGGIRAARRRASR